MYGFSLFVNIIQTNTTEIIHFITLRDEIIVLKILIRGYKVLRFTRFKVNF